MRFGPRMPFRFTALFATACVLAAGFPPAPSGAAGAVQQLGPVRTRDETPTLTLTRDGGMSVALPNGRDLWVFGDGPQFHWANGKWTIKAFVAGSSIASGPYRRGHVPAPMDEMWLGHKPSKKYKATVFIPPPRNVYFPDGSRKECSRKNGAAEEGRWPTGAALMPNKSFVLVTYDEVCVTANSQFRVEGWGFAIYNWKTNRLAAGPIDVFKPAKNGAAINSLKRFVSPIVVGSRVTLFAYTCCSPGHVYTTSMPATAKALSNPKSYKTKVVSGLPPSYLLSVSGKSPTQTKFQLLEQLDTKGRFAVYVAANIGGPWKRKASGLLPGCLTSEQPCYALYSHPELSTSTQLLVSYYLPGYGPGVKGHPHPHPPINHLVMASVPFG
jgi:hypothetical protein